MSTVESELRELAKLERQMRQLEASLARKHSGTDALFLKKVYQRRYQLRHSLGLDQIS